MSTPPGGERAGQDTESLVEVDVADEFKLDVYHALLLAIEFSQESYLISCFCSRRSGNPALDATQANVTNAKDCTASGTFQPAFFLCRWSPKRKLLVRPARYPHGSE